MGRGVASKGGKKEKRTRENRSASENQEAQVNFSAPFGRCLLELSSFDIPNTNTKMSAFITALIPRINYIAVIIGSEKNT